LAYSQADNKNYNWFNKDYSTDKVEGVSTEKAYNELLKGKTSHTVIVAVIDGGVDINHEDLKDIIWTNDDEIPENGIDDDNNGYIDDIHGWNFLGNDKGENVKEDNLEVTRIYRNYKDKYAGKTEAEIPESEKKIFEMYKKSEEIYKKDFDEYSTQKSNIETFITNYDFTDKYLKDYFKKDSYSLDELKKIETTDTKFLQVISFQKYVLENKIEISSLNEYLEYLSGMVDYNLNIDFDGRSIVGDNEEIFDGKVYGNNDVKGPTADHGTHVSGIIGAIRDNNIGINGIADNVKIMVVRTVPDGDEHDKDVAKSIIYAVDNGAQIINMSFGKSLSPHKEFVDKAVKYAEEKGVLLIHAAGNDGENNDKGNNFPCDTYLDGTTASNWIEVGASSMNLDKELCADFSNYGIINVDVFAPGVNIYSTLPENTYKAQDGTSMAAPVTTGVATVLKSYFPHLTAVELKEILLKSVTKLEKKTVYMPLSSEEEGVKPSKVKFGQLSVTGGVVNLYNAIKTAQTEY
jgi:subtilisin family serine protease